MINSKVDHVLVNAQVPTRKVHGNEFSYYKVLMDNGTPCDLLANKPRTTSVLYMCNPRSSNEVSLFSSPRRRYSVTLFSNVWEAVLISLLWASHGGYSNQEQGFWYCFTNGLNQSLVSSVAQGITELNIIGVISFLLTAIVAVILNLTESVINQQNVHQP